MHPHSNAQQQPWPMLSRGVFLLVLASFLISSSIEVSSICLCFCSCISLAVFYVVNFYAHFHFRWQWLFQYNFREERLSSPSWSQPYEHHLFYDKRSRDCQWAPFHRVYRWEALLGKDVNIFQIFLYIFLGWESNSWIYLFFVCMCFFRWYNLYRWIH